MARRLSSITLEVCLNGRRVGALRSNANGAVSFAYDATWLSWEHAFAISLSMPLTEESYRGSTVLAVFDNLLPDGVSIRRQIATRVGANGDDIISLLAKIGSDCVGALQFLPEATACTVSGNINAVPITNAAIATRIRGLAAAPLGLTEEDEAFRISLAGAQEKTALLRVDGAWRLPHGATPTTHILKPQIGRRPFGLGIEIDLPDSVENEQFCMAFCKAVDLPTAVTSIANFAGVRVLVSERFDRVWTQDGRLLRRPQEDFCQALGFASSQKYEENGGPSIAACMGLLQGSNNPHEDRRTFMKAILVYWVLGATDAHAKNFSIHLNPGGGFRLAPLYDVLSTQPHVTSGQLPHRSARLAMAVGNNRRYRVDQIVPRYFRETAAAVGFPAADLTAVEREITGALEPALRAAKASLPANFPSAMGDAIAAGARSRAGLFADPPRGG
ncbi:MAG: type II toxin-antitoxin system HipA family toxin [Alphaproteobacteria bacterium]|nr:MAG: type II toxin-antitoxin system HipA family toxin [Alphaproteobacteria bacterium]